MIKCRVFTGSKLKDGNKFRFTKDQVNGEQIIDEGYIDYYDKKEFELRIKKYAKLMGFSIDAYNEKDEIFWSNYQELEEKPDLDQLRSEYKELSGEEADTRWKDKRLSEEINKLKTD